MKIHAHILSWNEEKLLPFTLDYYSQFCERIFIYDNMSDDGSSDIYKKYEKVKVLKWNSNNEINELNYIQLKTRGYKERSRNQNVDWVVVCDCDEFLYHPNLIDVLKEYKAKGITVPKISGHDMVSNSFPNYDGDLLPNKIKHGSQRYQDLCKNIIFNPNLDINYGVGAHSFSCKEAVFSEKEDLKLLHYKLLGESYIDQMYTKRANRLSEFNKRNRFGDHYLHIQRTVNYMNELLDLNYKVI